MRRIHQHKTKVKKRKRRERTDTDTVKKPGHKQKSMNAGNGTRRQKYYRPEEGRRRTRRRKQACNRATEHDADKTLEAPATTEAFVQKWTKSEGDNRKRSRNLLEKEENREWHGGDEVVPGKRRNEGDGDNDPLGVFSLSF
jgi:hypothetical protein